MESYTDIIEQAKIPMYGYTQDVLLEQLDAYHTSMHGEEGMTAWTATINGSYQSMCGLKVDMLMALRVAGAMRN